jgi:hypothetical protein
MPCLETACALDPTQQGARFVEVAEIRDGRDLPQHRLDASAVRRRGNSGSFDERALRVGGPAADEEQPPQVDEHLRARIASLPPGQRRGDVAQQPVRGRVPPVVDERSSAPRAVQLLGHRRRHDDQSRRRCSRVHAIVVAARRAFD